MTVVVRPFREADLAVVKSLFTNYHVSLPIDISYQNYQDEFVGLPGKYVASQGGALLVAEQHGSVAQPTSLPLPLTLGCVALRRIDGTMCEMKRLYVQPAARGLHVGRALVQAIVEEARRLNYLRMRLDTLPSMTAAIALYKHFGFYEIPKYYDTPIEETVFFEARLDDAAEQMQSVCTA